MNIRKADKQDILTLLDFIMQLRRKENSLSDRIQTGKKTKDFLEKEFLEKRIDNKNYIFLIAENNNTPIGVSIGWKEFISPVYKNEYVGCVADLIVDENYRKQGVGKELLNALTNEFKKIGIKELKLEVLTQNKDSCGFWKKQGFDELYLQMRKYI